MQWDKGSESGWSVHAYDERFKVWIFQGARLDRSIENTIDYKGWLAGWRDVASHGNTGNGSQESCLSELVAIRRVLQHRPLSLSSRRSETITGTNHPLGFNSSKSSPRIAFWIASSLPSGGGGTFASHAMLMNTLSAIGVFGVVPSASEDALVAVPGTTVSWSALVFTQKPGSGLSGIALIEDISERGNWATGDNSHQGITLASLFGKWTALTKVGVILRNYLIEDDLNLSTTCVFHCPVQFGKLLGLGLL
jgi:hypothetical protein